MTKTLPLLTLALALLLTACAAASGGGRTADEELLMDCRAKADETGKARYTGPWERAVQDCLDQARTP